jgi:hypothetical protein
VRRSGAAPDNNTAIARTLHVTDATQRELFWNFDLSPGVAMMPEGNAPAIITADPVKLGVPETLNVGSATAPTGSGAAGCSAWTLAGSRLCRPHSHCGCRLGGSPYFARARPPMTLSKAPK